MYQAQSSSCVVAKASSDLYNVSVRQSPCSSHFLAVTASWLHRLLSLELFLCFQPIMQRRKRVAIVGSGCTGIGALWALKRTEHEVHLYEAAERLGGHTNTAKFKHGDEQVNVDTGFIVLNTATYRQYAALL